MEATKKWPGHKVAEGLRAGTWNSEPRVTFKWRPETESGFSNTKQEGGEQPPAEKHQAVFQDPAAERVKFCGGTDPNGGRGKPQPQEVDPQILGKGKAG